MTTKFQAALDSVTRVRGVRGAMLLAGLAPSGMLLVVVAEADINVGLARLEMLRAGEAVA